MEKLKINLPFVLIAGFILALIIQATFSIILNSNETTASFITFFILYYGTAAVIIISSYFRKTPRKGLCFSNEGLIYVFQSKLSVTPWAHVRIKNKKILFFNISSFVDERTHENIMTFVWKYYSSRCFIYLTKKYIPVDSKIYDDIKNHYLF